jgi:cytochrome P450
MLVALHVAFYAALAAALSWISGILVRTRMQKLKRPASCQPFQKRYPHAEPILGLDLSYQIWREFHHGEFCEGMRRRHEKHGDTFLAKDLGAQIIYTIDPDNIRTITTHNFQDYRKAAWTEEACKHVGRGVLMTDGNEWKRSRTMLRPIFARTAMDDPALLEPYVQKMLHAIRDDEAAHRQVDFQPISRRFTLDVVTDFLFGNSTLSLNPDPDGTSQGRRLLGLFDQFDPPAGTFIAVGLLAWIELLPSYPRISAVVSGMKTFFRNHMNEILSGLRQSSASAGTSCFRSMRESGMPDEVILGELQNVFFASFDTTTALLANIVGVLARRQDVLTRMRQEVEQLGEKRPDKADLKDLPYLHSVILEGRSKNSFGH